jgi:23S rRNA pseudoU1915 N3-methylase RlmH
MADALVETTAPPTLVGRHRVRRVFTALLVIVACVLAPVSVLALWAKTTVLDTSNYVSTVAPLASNSDIREAAATRITQRIMSEKDVVSQLEDKIPPRIAKRLPNLNAAAEAFVYDAALKFVSSPKFATLWEQANRRVQPQVVAALTGSSGGKVHLANDGTVTLDLSGVAKEVRARLEARGVSLDRVPAGSIDTTIELFKWPWLGTVQDGVDLLQQLAWFLPFLTLLCFAGGIALSTNRRRTVLRAGLGLAAGMLVILVALAVGRGPYLDLFATPSGRQAGGAAYDQLLHGLRMQVRGLFALGLIIGVGAWLTGRSPATTESTKAIRIGVIAVGFLALAALDDLTAIAVLVVAATVAIALVLVEVIARRHDRRVDEIGPEEISPESPAGVGGPPV